MPISVSVNGETGVSVSVGGSTGASVSVSAVGTGVSVSSNGGIGPAGFVTPAGTSANLYGVLQLASGSGITISTTSGQFTIASYDTAAVAALSAVQSVQGKTGAVTLSRLDVTAAAAVHTHSTSDIVGLTAGFVYGSHTHDAADVTSGTFSVSRIPTIGYTALSGVPTSFTPASHTHDASAISSGTISAARLPLATTTSVGAIQVGSGLSISSGVLSATGGGGSSSASFVSVPATFTSTGTAGTFAADSTYLYACYSANNWLRVQRAAWYAVPTVPQTFTLTAERGGATTDTVIASWTAPSNNGGQLLGYKLQLNTAATFTVSTATLTYQWDETPANTNACTLYSVSVKAFNSEGDSPAATDSRYAPNTTYPTDLVVTQTPTEGAPGVTYSASWLPACYGGYDQYQLQVRLYDAGNGAEDNWSTVGSPIVNSYTHYIADASSTTQYQWRVRANTVVNGNITASSVWSQITSTP